MSWQKELAILRAAFGPGGGFQEIYRFAMLRSLGKEWQLREVTLCFVGRIATDGRRGGGWLRRALRKPWRSLAAEPRVT